MKFIIKGKLSGLNEYIYSNRANAYAGASMKKKNEKLVWESIIANNVQSTRFHEPVFIRFKWIEPNRKRDKDNIAFATKFILDTLVKHGILEGDGWHQVEGFNHLFDVDKNNPRIEVEILTMEEFERKQNSIIFHRAKELVKTSDFSEIE